MSEVTKKDIMFIQNEIYEEMKQREEKLLEKINFLTKSCQKDKLMSDEKFMLFNDKFAELANSITNNGKENSKMDAISQRLKVLEDSIFTFSTKTNNFQKELSDACFKYDNIFIKNLSVPGLVGDGAQFHNIRQFLEHVNKKLKDLSESKEKQNKDMGSYKTKLDTVINNFKLQIDNIKESFKDLCKKAVEDCQKATDDRCDIIESRIEAMRMENGQYSNDLIKATEKVKADWEHLEAYKKGVNESIESEFKKFKNLFATLQNEFNANNNEFKNIKYRFDGLSEFIKDVRFKKNFSDLKQSSQQSPVKPPRETVEPSPSSVEKKRHISTYLISPKKQRVKIVDRPLVLGEVKSSIKDYIHKPLEGRRLSIEISQKVSKKMVTNFAEKDDESPRNGHKRENNVILKKIGDDSPKKDIISLQKANDSSISSENESESDCPSMKIQPKQKEKIIINDANDNSDSKKHILTDSVKVIPKEKKEKKEKKEIKEEQKSIKKANNKVVIEEKSEMNESSNIKNTNEFNINIVELNENEQEIVSENESKNINLPNNNLKKNKKNTTKSKILNMPQLKIKENVMTPEQIQELIEKNNENIIEKIYKKIIKHQPEIKEISNSELSSRNASKKKIISPNISYQKADDKSLSELAFSATNTKISPRGFQIGKFCTPSKTENTLKNKSDVVTENANLRLREIKSLSKAQEKNEVTEKLHVLERKIEDILLFLTSKFRFRKEEVAKLHTPNSKVVVKNQGSLQNEKSESISKHKLRISGINISGQNFKKQILSNDKIFEHNFYNKTNFNTYSGYSPTSILQKIEPYLLKKFS